MDGAAEILRATLGKLQIDAETKLEASRLVGDPQRVDRFLKEWRSDVISVPGSLVFRDSLADPSGRFLEWLRSRLEDPFHIGHRSLQSSQKRLGEDAGWKFFNITWRQEVAWAQRMRASENDRSSCLAAIWVAAAQKDPSRIFESLLTQAEIQLQRDTKFLSREPYEMMASEIRRASLKGLSWVPLSLRAAEIEFGHLIAGEPRRIAAAAQQARKQEMTEVSAEVRRRRENFLRRTRPALAIACLKAAVRHELSPADLELAEEVFIQKVGSGNLDLSPASDGVPEFIQFLEGRSGLASPPEAPEDLASMLLRLPRSWMARIPETWEELGGLRRDMLNRWIQSLTEGYHEYCQDLLLNYGIWLAEKHSEVLMRPRSEEGASHDYREPAEAC